MKILQIDKLAYRGQRKVGPRGPNIIKIYSIVCFFTLALIFVVTKHLRILAFHTAGVDKLIMPARQCGRARIDVMLQFPPLCKPEMSALSN